MSSAFYPFDPNSNVVFLVPTCKSDAKFKSASSCMVRSGYERSGPMYGKDWGGEGRYGAGSHPMFNKVCGQCMERSGDERPEPMYYGIRGLGQCMVKVWG